MPFPIWDAIGSLSLLRPRSVLPFPVVDERLVRALKEQFPDQAPDLDWNEREVWFRSGQVSVVRFLLAKLEEQTEGLLREEL